MRSWRDQLRKPIKVLRKAWRRLPRTGVESGIPPAWVGYRWVDTEDVRDYLLRCRARSGNGTVRYETIHPASISEHPLPRNLASRDLLPEDRGWWGYSFHDVPERTNRETFLATLPDCRIAPFVDERERFWVTLVNRDDRALGLREMSFRPWHAKTLRSRSPVRRKRATWVCERVHHNYSHWLTAHPPKFLLLQRRGELGDVLLPARRPSVIDESLRLFGMEPERFPTFDPSRLLQVEELTILETDRFRPELLRSVRDACPFPGPDEPHRRVFISRARASLRRLVNEDGIWPILEAAGFERVLMEEFSFEAQVALMRETAVLVAPHGAGLTNMIFCPPGTHVVELADLGFPNPNFYALASAMGLSYWLIPAEAVGDVHPLEKDLRVEAERVENVVQRILPELPAIR